jgi:hypothetical protein
MDVSKCFLSCFLASRLFFVSSLAIPRTELRGHSSRGAGSSKPSKTLRHFRGRLYPLSKGCRHSRAGSFPCSKPCRHSRAGSFPSSKHCRHFRAGLSPSLKPCRHSRAGSNNSSTTLPHAVGSLFTAFATLPDDDGNLFPEGLRVNEHRSGSAPRRDGYRGCLIGAGFLSPNTGPCRGLVNTRGKTQGRTCKRWAPITEINRSLRPSLINQRTLPTSFSIRLNDDLNPSVRLLFINTPVRLHQELVRPESNRFNARRVDPQRLHEPGFHRQCASQ